MRAVLSGVVGVVAAMVVLGGTLALGASADVISQAPPTVPVQQCVPGATVPTNLPANGPSPVGRCEPTDKQRVIDTGVFLFLVALLGLLAATGVVALVRSLRGHEVATPRGAASSVAGDEH